MFKLRFAVYAAIAWELVHQSEVEGRETRALLHDHIDIYRLLKPSFAPLLVHDFVPLRCEQQVCFLELFLSVLFFFELSLRVVLSLVSLFVLIHAAELQFSLVLVKVEAEGLRSDGHKVVELLF